jgi:RecJ-like exonuclease
MGQIFFFFFLEAIEKALLRIMVGEEAEEIRRRVNRAVEEGAQSRRIG